MNYPYGNTVNPKNSEILISYSRQELKNIDFDPTKPENYKKEKTSNINNPIEVNQFNSVLNNSLQEPPNLQQKYQNNTNTQNAFQGNSSVLKYQTQEEYHQNNYLNLVQSNTYSKIQKDSYLHQPSNNQQNTFNQNAYSQYYKEQK